MGQDYSERGGVRLGSFNLTWPFAKLSASHEGIRLSCAGLVTYSFGRADLVRLSLHRGFMNEGLRIEHDGNIGPDFIVFWSFSYARLEAALRQLGYTVATS